MNMANNQELASQNATESENVATIATSVNPIEASDEIDIKKEFKPMVITQHEAIHGKATSENSEELDLDDVMADTPRSCDFTLDIDKPSVKQAYDNAGAYATLLSIMERNSNINVEFRLDKENYHYAWVEAKGVAGFKYYLKNEAFNGIIKYLTKGEIADFDPAPLEYEKAKFTDDFYIMKLFVDKGIILQCTPLFRERLEYVTAFLPCRKGKITFRVKRTDDIVNYLREAGQCL